MEPPKSCFAGPAGIDRWLHIQKAAQDVALIPEGSTEPSVFTHGLPSIRVVDLLTVVDDSHGTGVTGKTGRGTIEHFGLQGQIDIITGTLGKALGGAAGGFVAGSRALIETLIQRSRPQLFSNALPATVACSSLQAIDYLDAHPELVAKLRDNVAYFRDGLKKIGYKPLEGDSAIVPISSAACELCGFSCSAANSSLLASASLS